MHTSRARPGPGLVKPCGVAAGPMTISPGPPSMLAADPDHDVALQDDEGLVVGMLMQVRSIAGPVVHEKERHRRWAVPGTFECAGNVIARQVISVHVVHGSGCLPVRGMCCACVPRAGPRSRGRLAPAHRTRRAAADAVTLHGRDVAALPSGHLQTAWPPIARLRSTDHVTFPTTR